MRYSALGFRNGFLLGLVRAAHGPMIFVALIIVGVLWLIDATVSMFVGFALGVIGGYTGREYQRRRR